MMTILEPTLAVAPFEAIITMVESMGPGKGDPVIIQLYIEWIAAQPPNTANVHAAWFNLGTELGHARRIDEAMQSYRNALALQPWFYPAATNLGLMLESIGQPMAALQVWRAALQPDEARIALLNQQGRLLEQMGRFAEAAEVLRKSLIISPEQPDAVQHWIHLRQKMCVWPVVADIIHGLPEQEQINQAGPLGGLAMTDDVALQCAINAAWIKRMTKPQEALAPLDGYRHDRIRVGYLSSDFCSHAMSYLIVELFERHDRSRFQVHGYCASPDDGSPIRERVIAAFDQFTRILTLSDEDAARQIRRDEIDILIDLNGLTSGGRIQLLRWKPAPVQATYLGFIGPVPLPELDAILCDDFVVPPEFAAAYQPRPVAIEGLYQANDSKRQVGETVSRAQVGLPEDRFVFCCPSNHYKITDVMFTGWMEILRQTGDSVLWLVENNQWSEQNMRQRALLEGIDPERLIFTSRVDPARYMARLGVADLMLDTFPYNAGTIASDAIRMSLPLLTLRGQSFASRMAARMLHAIDATEGITDTLADYVTTAVRLATDRERYASYKAHFTEAAWASSLGDIVSFTRHFENTLAGMVKRPEAVERHRSPALQSS